MEDINFYEKEKEKEKEKWCIKMFVETFILIVWYIWFLFERIIRES